MTLLVRKSWLRRNQILHYYNDDLEQEIHSMESAKLCHYLSNPKLLQSLDQHFCNNMTLNKLRQSHPSLCRRWLKQVPTSRTAYLKDGQNQQAVSNSADKRRRAHYARGKTNANNTLCTMQKHEHITATDDSILPLRLPDIKQETSQINQREMPRLGTK